jgi:uncharacterized cupredoxin-like copper-binding protein
MKRLVFFVAVMLLTVVALTACGPNTAELTVSMHEYSFTPSRMEVPASAEVELTLLNDGTLEHEYVIMNFGTMATVPFSDDDEGNIFWEHELEPATSEVVTFTAPGQAGEYQLVCGVEEHLEQGMEGTLVVR